MAECVVFCLAHSTQLIIMWQLLISDCKTVHCILSCIASFRGCMSSQAKAVMKSTEDYLQPQFGPNRRVHPAAVSEGSGCQDCSTHQTASGHSHDEVTDPHSCKSNSRDNSCFMSASKRNRPASAPAGQLR